MSIQVKIGEAKTRLSQLIAAAKRGERVVIARDGVPEALMVPIADAQASERDARAVRLAAFHGSFKGRLDMSLDWEAPSMSEDDMREWERREDARYAGGTDEAAA